MIGLTSSTTTVTFRTANVFARSSPTPEAPVGGWVLEDSERLIMRTSRDDDHLLSPFNAGRTKDKAALVAV